ncbi:C40 family peptidase [Verrucomicrobium spinosum]|uniref:C40 family peptidase n=1 Tax=Verrucomicrobium spinosum TaxID=2736 RepID=UPI0012E17744|nr:C40 family peptidase [Verrucomicrobium spinosum]
MTSSTCLACLLAGLLSAPVLRAQDSASINTLPIPPLPTAAPRAKVPEPSEMTATAKPAESAKAAHVATLSPNEIEGFDAYPAPLQTLITEALALTKLNLRYQFGSADPKSGGMDCSGTIYHLLHKLGVSDVPRSPVKCVIGRCARACCTGQSMWETSKIPPSPHSSPEICSSGPEPMSPMPPAPHRSPM